MTSWIVFFEDYLKTGLPIQKRFFETPLKKHFTDGDDPQFFNFWPEIRLNAGFRPILNQNLEMELKIGLWYLEIFINIYCFLQKSTDGDDRRFLNFVIDDSYRANDEKNSVSAGRS